MDNEIWKTENFERCIKSCIDSVCLSAVLLKKVIEAMNQANLPIKYVDQINDIENSLTHIALIGDKTNKENNE